MGLFEEAGRRFEQFKQKATAAAEEEAEYECYACGNRFYAAGDVCPECGSEAVAPAEDSEDSDGVELDDPDDSTDVELDDPGAADSTDRTDDAADTTTGETGDENAT